MIHSRNSGLAADRFGAIGCREPAQDRARISRDRILSATRELIMELGHDDLTLSDVSIRSGISVGSISFRFGAKENLFREVHIHALHLHLAQVMALSPEPGRDGCGSHSIVELVASFSRIFRQNAAFLTAAEDRGRRDPDTALLAIRVEQKSTEMLASRLLLCRDEMPGSCPPYKAEFAAKTVVDVLLRRAHSLLPKQDSVDKEDTELTVMCAAYLRSANRTPNH